MTGYIYKCTYNSKIYIGESMSALKKNYLGSGSYWKSIIADHRSEVIKEILEIITADNKKDLKAKMHEREIYWISKYDSTNPDIGYNISPGGNLMSEDSKRKMIEADSKAIKIKMQSDPTYKKRISESLFKQRNEVGMSDSHKQHLSDSLKNRNVGGDGDSRSIAVCCIVNNETYYFHNKIQAAKWWYDNYPFSDTYAEITYTRQITNSINNLPLKYKGKDIYQNIQWKLYVYKLDQPLYCIYNDKKYYFDNIESAAKWLFKNEPFTSNYSRLKYMHNIFNNIKDTNNVSKLQWFVEGDLIECL